MMCVYKGSVSPGLTCFKVQPGNAFFFGFRHPLREYNEYMFLIWTPRRWQFPCLFTVVENGRLWLFFFSQANFGAVFDGLSVELLFQISKCKDQWAFVLKTSCCFFLFCLLFFILEMLPIENRYRTQTQTWLSDYFLFEHSHTVYIYITKRRYQP